MNEQYIEFELRYTQLVPCGVGFFLKYSASPFGLALPNTLDSVGEYCEHAVFIA
jgi:hypothetical protein